MQMRLLSLLLCLLFFTVACEELKYFRTQAHPASANAENQPMPDPDLRDYSLNSFSKEQALASSWFFWKPGVDKAEVLVLLKKTEIYSQKLSEVKVQKALVEQKRNAYLQEASGGEDPTSLSEEESEALLESTPEGQEIARTYNLLSSNEQALQGQVGDLQAQLQVKTEVLAPARFFLKTTSQQLSLKVQGLEILDADGNKIKDCSTKAHTIPSLKYETLGGKIQALLLCKATTQIPSNSTEYILLSIERIPSAAGDLRYTGNMVRCVDTNPPSFQIEKCAGPVTYGQIQLGN